MKFTYVEKAYKVVIAAALAVGLVTALSTFASGPEETTIFPSPVVTPH